MAYAPLDHDLDVYAMLLINKMRANPADFGKELKNLYLNTGYVSSHGMRGDDPIWVDLRSEIKQSEGKTTAAGMKWFSGFDGRSGTTFLSVISSLPQTGPLVLDNADEAAADNHTQWMMKNGYAHTGHRPQASVEGLGYNPSATPNTWDATDKDYDGPFAGRAENISYWYSNGYSATFTAWRQGKLTWEQYFQRLVYADTLGFMLENHNGSETDPWGHLLNLASYSPDHPSAAQAAPAGNKKLGVLNGLGISFQGGDTATYVTTHRLSYAPGGRYVAIVTYQDLNDNKFYDVGEGLDLTGVVVAPFKMKPGLPNVLGYDVGGVNTGSTMSGPGLFNESVSEDYGKDITKMSVKIDGRFYRLPDARVTFSKRNMVLEYRYPRPSLGLSESTLVPEVIDSEANGSLPVVVAPYVTLGSGVADGATRAEATLPSGVVAVSGEKNATVYVNFVGTTNGAGDPKKVVTKTVAGQGADVPVTVTLTDADLAKLTDGRIDAVATQVDAAGNWSPNAVVSFTLDTVAPLAPGVMRGAGVADGAARTEALQASGVVTVSGERNSTIFVNFIGTTNGRGDAKKMITKTVAGQGPGVAVPVALTDADLQKLTDGRVDVVAAQLDAAGNWGSSGSVSFSLDTVAPPAAVVVLGAGVADGATRAEARQPSGVVTVSGEMNATVYVTFVGTTNGAGDATKLVTKKIAGQGPGIRVPVSLTHADIATLTDGRVDAVAAQIDAAGNWSANAVVSFTLDTTVPIPPRIILGTGIIDGATPTEARQSSGVVTVSGERNATLYVNFVGSTNGRGDARKVVTKTVAGQGWDVSVPVTLTAADIAKLTDGRVDVATAQIDAAGNWSPSALVSFTLDTVAPTVSSLAVSASRTYRPGDPLLLVATFSESVVVRGTPFIGLVLDGNVSRRASYVSGSGTKTVVFQYLVQGGDNAAQGPRIARVISPGGGAIVDAAGNTASLVVVPPPSAGVIISSKAAKAGVFARP